MGKESKVKTIGVYCINNHLLFERYRKVGAGRLQKCFRDEIGVDHTRSDDKQLGDLIYCLQCNPMLPVAIVAMIHGRVAYKVKSSGIRKIVT